MQVKDQDWVAIYRVLRALAKGRTVNRKNWGLVKDVVGIILRPKFKWLEDLVCVFALYPVTPENWPQNSSQEPKKIQGY